MKKTICILLLLCCILPTYATKAISSERINPSVSCDNEQNNNTQWWTARALSVRIGDKSENWEDCNIRILQEERVIKIFTEETLKLISVANETIREDNDGIIFQERKCVDDDGKRCLATFIYYPAKHIFLIVEYNDISVCYAIQPD